MDHHQQALHLTKEFTAFSDGFAFSPGFTKETDAMWPKTSQIGDDFELDELHLNATATFGPIQIHINACWDDTILVGESGRLEERITVRQLLDVLNAWCSAPAHDGQTKVDQYITCGRSYCPLWGGLRRLPYDVGTQRYAYELLTL